MSAPRHEETEAAIEELRDVFGGSPLHSDMELYFHPPRGPSPHFSDLCLSPLWNFEEYAAQSYSNVTSVMDFPQSLSCGFEPNKSPAEWPPLKLCTLKNRISVALRYLKESIEQHILDFLVQVWIPVKNGNRYLLTTSGAPFLLDPQSEVLLQYRMVSLMYIFSADDENDDLGVPGRVFRSKLPEWTPNVQYYSSKEYPLLNHALHYNIRGMLALPLFEPGGCCIGVLEVIMTSQKINYAPEIDLLCKALKAVELKSSEILYQPLTRVLNENQHTAFSEILEVLTVVSENCRLPLAQTWILCSHGQFSTHGRSLPPCNRYNIIYSNKVCMSTCDIAFYVVDAHMWGFREACSEHHLLEGQGVVGRAFSSLDSFFHIDITQLTKADYPLVHYARMFGLQSCLAVPVCNPKTANDLYILEFFLPPHLTDRESQNKLLALVSEKFRQSFQNLRIVSHKEFRDEREVKVINFPLEEKVVLGPEYYERSQNIRLSEYGREHNQTLKTLDSTCMPEAAQAGTKMVKTMSDEKQKELEVHVIHCEKKTDEVQGSVSAAVPGKEDRRTLEVLQQLYGRSLQDAAECLGVSRSTIKRLCRKLGIARWPSRKRKKINSVNHLNESGIPMSTLKHGFAHHTQPEMQAGRFMTKKSSTDVKELEPWGVEKQVLISSTPLLPSSNLALNQEKAEANAAIASRTQAAATAPGEMTLPVNARYQRKTIKFLLHFPLTMTNLEKKLAEMLELKLGTFNIKYLDTENDWILMSCDDDLQDLIVVSRSTWDRNGIVQMIVQGCKNSTEFGV